MDQNKNLRIRKWFHPTLIFKQGPAKGYNQNQNLKQKPKRMKTINASIIATCAVIANVASAVKVATGVGCSNEWIWEECSWSWYREPCDYESSAYNENGWFYWDDWSGEEFWVSEDDFATWESCWWSNGIEIPQESLAMRACQSLPHAKKWWITR